jgi:hypothetical protein
MHAELMKSSTPPMSPDAVEALYGQYYETGEKIRTEYLGRMNYRFTACFMSIGAKYKLFELLPTRGDGPAEHSFLSIDKTEGVLIPDPLYKHRIRLKALAPPVAKKLISKTAFQPAPAKKVDPHEDKSKREESRRTLPENKGKAAAVDRWAV